MPLIDTWELVLSPHGLSTSSFHATSPLHRALTGMLLRELTCLKNIFLDTQINDESQIRVLQCLPFLPFHSPSEYKDGGKGAFKEEFHRMEKEV